MEYRVKNWDQFQHYRDRNPPWIKLHFALLASKDWVMLDDASRVLAIACMLVASRNGGLVPADPDYLKRVAYLNKRPDFKPLISCGFLEDASGCKQMLADARPEERQRRDRGETETEGDGPNKKTKSASRIPEDFELTELRRAYALKNLPNVDAQALFEAFTDHWRAKSGKDATKLDWDAGWRTWVRNALKFGYPMIALAIVPKGKREPTPDEITAAQRKAAEDNQRQLAKALGGAFAR